MSTLTLTPNIKGGDDFYEELLNAHELDATTELEGVLQVLRLAVWAWMAPLELYAVRLANDFGEHALSNEALLR